MTQPTAPQMGVMDLPFFTADDPDFSLENWIENIKLVHEFNSWTPRITARFALARMRGTAGRKAAKLSEMTFDSLESLIDAVRTLFRDRSSAAMRFRDAYQNGQGPFEAIDKWGRRVREIVEDYLGRPFQEKQAVQLFVDMLRDGNTILQLKLQDPTTLKDAIEYAERYSKLREHSFTGRHLPPAPTPAGAAFTANPTTGQCQQPEPMEIDQMSRRYGNNPPNRAKMADYQQSRPRQGSQAAKNPATPTARAGPACFYCSADDHFVRECPLKKEHEAYSKRAQQSLEDLQRRRERSSRSNRGQRRRTQANRVQEICELMEKINDLQLEEADSIGRNSEAEDDDDEGDDDKSNENPQNQQQDFQ